MLGEDLYHALLILIVLGFVLGAVIIAPRRAQDVERIAKSAREFRALGDLEKTAVIVLPAIGRGFAPVTTFLIFAPVYLGYVLLADQAAQLKGAVMVYVAACITAVLYVPVVAVAEVVMMEGILRARKRFGIAMRLGIVGLSICLFAAAVGVIAVRAMPEGFWWKLLTAAGVLLLQVGGIIGGVALVVRRLLRSVEGRMQELTRTGSD